MTPPKTSTVDTLAKILSQNFYYKLDSEGGKVVCLNQKRAMQQLNQLLYDARLDENEHRVDFHYLDDRSDDYHAGFNEAVDQFVKYRELRTAELKALKGESTQ